MTNDVQPGHWYLCGECKTCGSLIPLIECPPPPAPPVSGSGDFAFQNVPCEECGVKHDYRLLDAKRVPAGVPPGSGSA